MDLTQEEKLAQLEKVLQSRALQGSENLRAFLRFVVVKSLENQEGLLKEYTIATEVFGRSDDYDSRSDSVVRVQAGRLRSKLQKYYATEGKNDTIIIDLPKGHYAPSFSSAESANRAGANGASGSRESPPRPEGRTRFDRWLAVTAIGLALLVLALGLYFFGFRSEASRPKEALSVKGGLPDDARALSPLWADFLRSSDSTLVTFSNTLFQGTAETGMHLLRPMDSPEKASGAFGNKEGSIKDERGAITEHYTGVGEVMGIYALGDFFYRAGHSIRVKRSLLLSWDDLKTENIIVLGSPAENFHMRDLPQKQDFIFQPVRDEHQNLTLGIINTNPQPGEQRLYLARQDGPSRSQISEDYALVSCLRGLDSEKRLMILAGITTYGTQAAAEYMTRPEHLEELIERLNASPGAQSVTLPSYYQVLLKVKVNDGVPVQISYVTHHAL